MSGKILKLLVAVILYSIASQSMGSEIAVSPIISSDSLVSIGKKDWKTLLWNRQLDINDTTIQYPRFIKFCLDVYRWGDRVFNSYDNEYVEGTGKKWKVILKSDNWLDSYAMNFQHKMPVFMSSDIYYNLGINVSFMALSAGYMIDMSNLIGNKPALHKKFEFGFTCARFVIDTYYSENTGGTMIRRFSDYNDGRPIKETFPGLKFRSYGADLYYFLNNRKYSQGAVYNFSKYQKRSAGSFIFGITASNHEIEVNFNSLPEKLEPYYKLDGKKYKFHYNDFCIIAGYGYNFCFGKHLTLNLSALPNFGFKHALDDCVDGRDTLFSLNLKAKTGLTYNLKDFFAGLHLKMDGHWFLNKNFSFFNSIENFALMGGFRF